MFLAKPNANNFLDCKSFASIQGAKTFLDNYTEYKMTLLDWISIGKILGTDKTGNTYDLIIEDYE